MFACNQIDAILAGLNWRLARAEISAIVDDAAADGHHHRPGRGGAAGARQRARRSLRRILRLGDGTTRTWRAARHRGYRATTAARTVRCCSTPRAPPACPGA